MRGLMADETTPQRNVPPKPPRTYLDHESLNTSHNASVSTSESMDVDISPNNSPPELQRYYSAIDIVQPSSDSQSPSNQDITNGLNVPRDSIDGSTETLDNSSSSSEADGSGNLNLNRPDEAAEKVHCKRIPELVLDDMDDDLESEPDSPQCNDTHKTEPDIVKPDDTVTPEPDIVQCVRTRKEPPPRPVAPPRRKKKPGPVDTIPEGNVCINILWYLK